MMTLVRQQQRMRWQVQEEMSQNERGWSVVVGEKPEADSRDEVRHTEWNGGSLFARLSVRCLYPQHPTKRTSAPQATRRFNMRPAAACVLNQCCAKKRYVCYYFCSNYILYVLLFLVLRCQSCLEKDISSDKTLQFISGRAVTDDVCMSITESHQSTAFRYLLIKKS